MFFGCEDARCSVVMTTVLSYGKLMRQSIRSPVIEFVSDGSINILDVQPERIRHSFIRRR